MRDRDDREDWRAAFIIATILNVNRDTKKSPNPIRPEDVMPWLAKEKKSAKPGSYTPKQMRQVLEVLTRAMGGIIRPDRVPLEAGARK